MSLFVLSVATVLIVSALCSLTEAAIYAVRTPYVRHLAEGGSAAGRLLADFKQNMEQPISAILIANTAANTAGAAVAGTQAAALFGDSAVIWFSALFTLAVLFFSEIIPKVVGVAYARTVAPMTALPLKALIAALYPMIWIVQQVTQVIKPREPALSAPEAEVQQLALISAEEGSILPFEAELVKNVLRLNDIRARDIMTPRTVVTKLPASMTLRQVAAATTRWPHSRIPVFEDNDPDNWVGVVLTRDILTNLAGDRFDMTLKQLAGPIYFVPESNPGHILLSAFLKRRTHLFGVVDEHGSVLGVVTLEDVLESVIGEEIVDEADPVVDMQELARRRHEQRQTRHGEASGHDMDSP